MFDFALGGRVSQNWSKGEEREDARHDWNMLVVASLRRDEIELEWMANIKRVDGINYARSL